MGAVFGSLGILRLIDQNQRYMRGGLQAWLRTKNFVDNAAYSELGFQFVPSVTGTLDLTGVTDTLIDPPPVVLDVSLHSLGMASAAGVQLRAGAKTLIVSHSWVKIRQAALGYANPRQVFNDPSVVGIVTDNLLCEIVTISHEDAFSNIMEWRLQVNTSEYSAA